MKLVTSSFLLLAALSLGALAVAQTRTAPAGQQQPTPRPTPEAEQDDPNQRETVTTRIVRLPITVVDKKDQPVPGLKMSDFLVFEDKLPQQIESFSDENEVLPVYVAVLMDTSSSTAGKLKFEQEAALDFIHTVVRLRKDKVAFATFDDDIELLQDFTNKLDLLDKAVWSVKKPGTQTSLYDAIWQICDEKMRGLGSARRAMVVITDGDDTYSRATLREAIDIAQRTETIVFAISTKAGFSGTVGGVEAGQVHDQGDRDLVKLCEETGGKAFFTGEKLALERSFTKVAKELRSQYLITYKPSNDKYDGSFRRIEVRLANNRDGYKVRTKRGYTAIDDTVR